MTGRARAVASYAKRRRVPTASEEEEECRAKAYALQCIANLVEEGLAQLAHTADGASELRLVTGEVYRLGANTLRRIA
jgi:hypothetical protein